MEIIVIVIFFVGIKYATVSKIFRIVPGPKDVLYTYLLLLIFYY